MVPAGVSRRGFCRRGMCRDFVEPAEIGPAGRKADHGDAVVAGDMPRHDLVGRGVEGFRDILEVDAVLAAIDHRNAPAPGLCRRRNRPLRERENFLAELFEIDLHGVVMHQQRAIGRHGLGDARDRLGGHGTVERQHPPVGGIVDVAAEFHRDGAVATRQKAGRGIASRPWPRKLSRSSWARFKL